MEEIKTDDDIWKSKVNNAIASISSIQDELHYSVNCLNDQIVKFEFKSAELTKALETLNHSKDVNESLFSPYEDKQKKAEEVNLKNELFSVKTELPKLKKELEQLAEKNKEYSLIRDCLEYLKTILHKECKEIENHGTDDELEENYNLFLEVPNQGMKVLEAQEFERQRIARDLHDSTIQNLTNLMHKTELCIKLLDMDEIRARLELATLINSIRNIINDMREIIYDLRPMSLQDLGLDSMIEQFITKYKEENLIQITFEKINNEKEVLPVVNLTLYRIIQEACNNIAKYANATECKITLKYEENEIILIITDNGVGMELDSLEKKDCSDNSGFGLSIMKERALLLSGSFHIESDKESGTKITVNIPYRK